MSGLYMRNPAIPLHQKIDLSVMCVITNTSTILSSSCIYRLVLSHNWLHDHGGITSGYYMFTT